MPTFEVGDMFQNHCDLKVFSIIVNRLKLLSHPYSIMLIVNDSFPVLSIELLFGSLYQMTCDSSPYTILEKLIVTYMFCVQELEFAFISKWIIFQNLRLISHEIKCVECEKKRLCPSEFCRYHCGLSHRSP